MEKVGYKPETDEESTGGPRALKAGDRQERHPNVSREVMPEGLVTFQEGKWYVGGWQVDNNGYYAVAQTMPQDQFDRLKQMSRAREAGIGIGLNSPK